MIEINRTAAEKSFLTFKKINEGLPIQDKLIDEYYNTPGIVFLCKHLKHYGGSEFTKDILSYFLNSVIINKNIIPDDNIFLKSMKYGLKYADITEKEFMKTDIDKIIDRASHMAGLYLPEPIHGNILIYLLYGVRGTGISLNNEIAIDLCDKYFNSEGHLDEERMVNILAHELHHIEVNYYLNIKKQNEKERKNRLLIDFIGELMSEGAACYYLPNPSDREEMLRENWNNNIKDISNILYDISNIIKRIVNGSLTDLKDTDYLFSDSLEGYTAGFIMAKLIHETFGKDKLINSLKDCFMFIELYNQSVRRTSYGYHEILLKP